MPSVRSRTFLCCSDKGEQKDGRQTIETKRRQKERAVGGTEGRLDSPNIKTTGLKADCTLIEISNVPSVGENTNAISSWGKDTKYNLQNKRGSAGFMEL